MSTLSAEARAPMLDGFDAFMGTGAGTAAATLYQTNTALAVFNLSNTPFGTGNLDSIILASTPITNTGTAVAGSANRLVLTNRDGDTALTFTVSTVGGGGEIVTPSIAVAASQAQTLNSLVLRMAASGAITAEASFTLNGTTLVP